jgi:hypothetical protein
MLLSMKIIWILGFVLFSIAPAEAYTSRGGRFTCPNPLENSLGSKMEESDTNVSFWDDFGQRYRVDTQPLDAEGRNLISQHGKRSYLEAMLKGYYFPLLIEKSVPGSAIQKGAYWKDVHGGAYMIHVFLPKAGPERTHFDLEANTKEVTRLDTVRAILVFIEKNQVVFVSHEISPIHPKGKKFSPQEKAQRSSRLDKETVQFARQIQITPE